MASIYNMPHKYTVDLQYDLSNYETTANIIR